MIVEYVKVKSKTEKRMEEFIVDEVSKNALVNSDDKENIKVIYNCDKGTTKQNVIYLIAAIRVSRLFNNPTSYSKDSFVKMFITFTNVDTNSYAFPDVSIESRIGFDAYGIKYQVPYMEFKQMFNVVLNNDATYSYTVNEEGLIEVITNKLRTVLYELNYQNKSLENCSLYMRKDGEDKEEYGITPEDGAFIRTPKNGLYMKTCDELNEQGQHAAADFRLIVDTLKSDNIGPKIFLIVLFIITIISCLLHA